MSLTPPEPLASYHSCTDFACGIASLDDWLKHRAYTNQTSGATRTFVIGVDNRYVLVLLINLTDCPLLGVLAQEEFRVTKTQLTINN